MGDIFSIGASVVGGLLGQESGQEQAGAITAAGQRGADIATEAGALGAEQFAPFQESGVSANQTIIDALSGGAGAQNAFDQFQRSTGFQSQLAAGGQAITGNQAASGLLQSGSTLKQLSTFGQDLAQQGFGNFLGQLGGVADRGLGAAGGAARSITGAGGQAAQAITNTGVQAAGAQAGGRGAFQSGLGAAFEGIAGLF